MKLFETGPRAKRLRRNATTALGLLVLASLLALTLARASGAAATAVPLGTAASFGVLAGAGITNTGPTTINGDIGTFPTTSISGAGSMTITGVNHAGDAITQQAKNDWTTAFNNAAGQGPTIPIVANLGGQTLTAGVYNSASTIGLTGTLTLDGGGNFDSVFVFQAGSALTTASASQVSLTNGARACNVFWQVGSSATLGTGSSFVGTLLASSSISVTTGASVHGRVLASTGTVTLDTNVIRVPSCASLGPQPAPNASRQIYCDSAGTAYDLLIGQDKSAPYDTLGLVPSTIDPATGAKVCARVAAPTTTTTTTTTAPTTTPTPAGPTAKQVAAAKAKRAAAVKAAKVAKARRIAAAKSRTIVKQTPKPKPKPPVKSFGFTG
jgi:hypothetical protein